MAGLKKIKGTRLAVQAYHLRTLFPDSDCTLRPGCLIWEADLTPSALSRTYRVQITYRRKKSPDILVLKPKLIVPKGEYLPHTYSGDRLCLYYPGNGEWRKDMLLVKTIVPWISEWLLNYEIWLVTGIWCGGGAHPSTQSESAGSA